MRTSVWCYWWCDFYSVSLQYYYDTWDSTIVNCTVKTYRESIKATQWSSFVDGLTHLFSSIPKLGSRKFEVSEIKFFHEFEVCVDCAKKSTPRICMKCRPQNERSLFHRAAASVFSNIRVPSVGRRTFYDWLRERTNNKSKTGNNNKIQAPRITTTTQGRGNYKTRQPIQYELRIPIQIERQINLHLTTLIYR